MEVDPSIVAKAIEVTSARALGEPEPELPHPLVTDKILADRLDSIGHHLDPDDPIDGERSVADRLRDRAQGRSLEQERFNSSVVHLIHQLDHRTRYQQSEIVELRSQLESASGIIAQMARRIKRLEDPEP